MQQRQEAMTLYGCPEIFNSDQGSQYTSHEHTDLLKKRSPNHLA